VRVDQVAGELVIDAEVRLAVRQRRGDLIGGVQGRGQLVQLGP
jgi:hypothetical protein